jgi:hypothetical protein
MSIRMLTFWMRKYLQSAAKGGRLEVVASGYTVIFTELCCTYARFPAQE